MIEHNPLLDNSAPISVVHYIQLHNYMCIYICIIYYYYSILFVRAWLEFQIVCLILTILTSRMSLNKLIDIELCFPLCQNRKLKSRFFFEDRKWSLDSEKWNRDGFIKVPLNPLVHYSFHQMAMWGCNYHIFIHFQAQIPWNPWFSFPLPGPPSLIMRPPGQEMVDVPAMLSYQRLIGSNWANCHVIQHG